MSWISKALGLDKVSGKLKAVETAAVTAEKDIEAGLAKGLAAVAAIESAVADPANFTGDVVAANAAIADIKAGFADFGDVITAFKSI